MKRIRLLFVMASLCLVLSALKAQEFPSSYYPDELHFAMDVDRKWHAQRSAIMSNEIQLIAPPYQQDFDGVIYYLNVELDGANFRLDSSEVITISKPNGRYTLRTEMMKETTGDDYRISETVIDFQVKAQDYISPDEVWDIHLSKEEYTPPFADLYTSPHLEHYNIGEAREARAMIKLGEGNNKLTRPLILIDGVDFSHDIVLEKGTDRVIRYGDTGWENVIQGVESSFTTEEELFRTYPTLLRTMNEEQDEKGEVNYDIILVEFKDGADYIDRCAKLIQKVLERINKEKECGYENVIVGLSMGGQATRIALTQMEKNGIDHDCSEYISFDSPHEYANIPLGIQALVYAAGFVAGEESIGRRFEELNRPAALQMLRFNLYTEMAAGNVTMEHTIVSNDPTSDFESKIDKEQIVLENPIQAWKLREYYTNLQQELGYPKYCKNTALGMGSKNGSPLHPSSCLLDGKAELSLGWKLLLIQALPITSNKIKVNIANALAEFDKSLIGVELNAIGGESEEILNFRFPKYRLKLKNIFKNYIHYHRVTLTRNIEYPNVDIAPGCSRGDVSFLQEELNKSMKNALIKKNEFALYPPWTTNWNCKLPSTTFMPTASLIGVETDDLTMDLEKGLEYEIITTPFDEIFLTKNNLGHVEVYGANEGKLEGNDVGAFLVGRAEANVKDMPELTTLPSSEYGAKYNYGLYKRRLSSFTLNNGAVLSVNHSGETHFVDTDPREVSNKEYFKSALSGSTCAGPTEIVVNNGGLFQLGDPKSSTKSGEVRMFEGSTIQVNTGGKMTLENKSLLLVEKGASLSLAGSSHLELNGQQSVISIAGKFQTTGDVTIECKGKIIFLPTAEVSLGGKLTINGDVMNDNLLDLHENIALVVNDDFNITNGTILFRGNNKIEVKNGHQSIFQNIKILEKGNIYSEIHIKNVSNVLISNVEAKFFLHTTPFRIEGTGSESVQIQKLMIKNSGNALLLSHLNMVSISNSQFLSDGFIDDPKLGLLKVSNGIDAKNIELLNIENTNFDGFIDDVTLLKDPNPDKVDYYGLRLQDVHTVNINGSTFSNSQVGIYAPLGSFKDGVNETNVYLHGVKIKNNLVGIDMHGSFAESSTELNYGHLYLECTRILENLNHGIRGVNILLSADNYFADGENEINYFEPHYSTPVNEGGLIKLQYSFNDNYINPLLLRGNVWTNVNDPKKYISVNNNDSEFVVVTYPEYGSEDFPSGNECYTLKDEKDMKGDCKGCFTSDDKDGEYALKSNGKTIMETLREGIRHISDGDLVTAKATFQHIANVPSATIKTLHAKSQYAYELSRVYATPEASFSFGKRSSSSASPLVGLDLRIYPNPTTSDITLDVTEAGDYRITSVSGEVVQTGTYQVNDMIRLQKNAPGIYFVYFKSKSGLEKTGRFIVIK